MLGVPSLPFAVGLYLPIRLSTPIMMGGLVRLAASRTSDARELHARRERGVLFGSGLIAGGGIMGLLVAFLENAHVQRERLLAEGEPIAAGTRALAALYDRVHLGFGWAGDWSGLVAIVAFMVLVFALVGSVGLIRRTAGRKGNLPPSTL
jgi:hypothetical protein